MGGFKENIINSRVEGYSEKIYELTDTLSHYNNHFSQLN